MKQLDLYRWFGVVKVTDPLELLTIDETDIPSSIDVYTDDAKTTFDVSILSGNGNYVVSTSDPEVATATVDQETKEISVSIVSDGWFTLTVADQLEEKLTQSIFVNLDVTDFTERFSWGGYRAELSDGCASEGAYTTTKFFYWYTNSTELREGDYYYFSVIGVLSGLSANIASSDQLLDKRG